jgi:alanyl-tRNA synthetase
MTDMTLPRVDTVVLYPGGEVSSAATVLHVEVLGGAPGEASRAAVLLDRTAFHPVDAAWPDQGPDRGVLVIGGRGGGSPSSGGPGGGATTFGVVDCVVGATDGTELFLGGDVPVRKGTEGWAFVVAHIVELADAAEPPAEGQPARAEVDAEHRRALSAGHTACHLASLALNAALAEAWSKEAPGDARGNPDFDALAIESSTIGDHRSLDVYRTGKSLRKKGFAPAVLTDHLGSVAARAGALLEEWRASGAAVSIEREGDGLTDRRRWVCALPDGVVSIPCGGTHLESLSVLAALSVELELEEQPSALELRMLTRATPVGG